MQGISRNVFRGQNTDVAPHMIDPIYATDIQNLSLVSNGNFMALQNVMGTTKVVDIINVANTEVIGVFESKYKIGDEFGIPCLTIFTYTVGGNFKIWVYDTSGDSLYEVYEEPTPVGYAAEDRIVDCTRFAESGLDILLFTDFYNEIRQIRCEIPLPYSPNFLSEYDLSLQRRGANGTFLSISVTGGGSLLSGTYQFAYRMVDPETKKFTKWSSLTNPIHVYVRDLANYISYAGIGLPTNQEISFFVDPTQEERNNFNYFQLAVVENIYPLTESATTASLLEVRPVSDLSGVIEYSSNTKVGTIPIEDIVVDLAPIQTAKTLNTKLNKLFLGNIKYRPLDLDNGTPAVTSGSIATQTSTPATLYYQPDMATNKKGYFRDEVYRFGIVYSDKYGNRSAPVALDLSGVTGNQISMGLKDIKFPSRSTSNTYSLLDSSDCPRALGLQLNGIVNHPTWAVGFEIVRVKRIKRISFQSPVIPSMSVEGIGAFLRYPSLINTTNDDADTKEYADAQPMTSSQVIVPKNLFWPERRDIVRRTTSVDGDGIFGSSTFNRRAKGEAQITNTTQGYDLSFIFPQPDIYGDKPYTYIGNESLDTIDFCICKLDVEEFNTSEVGTLTGNHINTRIGGNFYALRNGDYYFDSAWVGKSISDSDNQVTEYKFIDNLGSGITLAGYKVLQYDELQTSGVPLGYVPTNQKIAAVKTKSQFNDNVSKTFANGVKNAYASNGYLVGSSGPRYETMDTTISNKYINRYSNFSENSSYVQMLRIVNVVRGEVGDKRYGDMEAQHEYISTGAKYYFSPSELSNVAVGNSVPVNIQVWGGDCFIGYHLFKVSDSTYSVVNQTKNNGSADSNSNLRKQWDNILYSIPTSGVNPNPKICIPVALEKVSQYVQIFLESEYNGEVRDYDVMIKKTSTSSTPIFNVSSENGLRTPLTYNYNINLSKENDQKVYLSIPENFVIQNDFKSRIAISDQKVYNSDVQGFDIFRVNNFYDLEESGGHLTKIGLGGDNMYSVQERRISYLPVGANQIEQTDAGTLSVGVGSDIGRPIVIDTNKGGQHLRGIVETGNLLYIPDNRNKAVYALAEQNLAVISDKFNATLWRNKFDTVLPENEVLGIYDSVRKEYWVAGTDFCQRFNETLDAWVGNFQFSGLKGGVATNQNLYLIGKVGNQVSAYSMYTGNYNDFFGTQVTPRVTFISNYEPAYSKTFDNLMFVASDRLDTVDLVVKRESSLGDQTVSGMIIDQVSQEGNYRVKIMRDADNARLRGLWLVVSINWKTANVPVSLSEVQTKIRLSARTPW